MTSPGEPRPKNAAQAAKQFEALMIAQMLRTAHESSSGSLDADSDSSADTMFDVAGQQFAQILANNGGLGLAKTVLQGLQSK
jgi:Rod binding domain-containing protein